MMHPDNEYLLKYMERLRSYAERYGMPFENDTALDFDWCLEMVDRAEQKGKADAIEEILQLPQHNHYDIYGELMYRSVETKDIEQVKGERMIDWYEEMERAEQEYDAKLADEARVYQDGYQQGRADKYHEIVSEYMLLTEKQVEEVRADAIDEFVDEVDKAITEMEHDSKIERTIHNACIVGMIIGTMKRIADELKEQNNGT